MNSEYRKTSNLVQIRIFVLKMALIIIKNGKFLRSC